MNHKQFIKNALKTESHVETLNIDEELLLTTLESFVIITEMLDCIKKKAFYNNDKKFNEKFFKEYRDRLYLLVSNMKVKEYIHLNYEENPPKNVDTRFAHGVIGIATESGELVQNFIDHIKNPKQELDIINIMEELFDADWYKAVLSDNLGFKWEDGWEKVINKLKARFGEKFDEKKASNRNLKNERKILEK